MTFRVRRTVGVLAAAVLLVAVTGGVAATVLHSMTASPAGCATPAASIDFSQDQAANLAAGNAIGRFPDELFRQPGYAEIQVVPCGIEIDVVGKPTAVELAIARDAPQYQGRDIPVRFRSVRYSEKDLKATMRMIDADAAGWSKRGIQLSFVGINAHDRVEISVAHYRAAYRTALRLRYGDRIVVDSHDVQFVNQ
jgi:hypothetical protein